jgi:sugar (pentulose or hexulose) kinase
VARAEALIGLDFGTTSVKGVVLDPDGTVLDSASSRTPASTGPEGLFEHDARAVWATACEVLTGLTQRSRAAGRQTVAVAIASMGEAGVPVDRNGAALHPIIGWRDERAGGQMRKLETRVGAARLERIVGHPVDRHWGIPRLMWLSEEHPATLGRTRNWLSVGDFILLQLTGVVATDPSLASRMMAFDQRRGRWSEEVVEAAGVRAALLPEVAPSGSVAGTVSLAAARFTGLTPGTPVALGGHDRACGALAARGGTDCAVDSAGTAEALMVSLPLPIAQKLDAGHAFACYFDVVPNRQLVSARVGLAGGLIDWARAQLLGDGSANADYETVFSALSSGTGFSGVVCYPAFGRSISPAWVRDEVPGAFAGITMAHTRDDLVRAILEGPCFSLRANVTALEELLGRPLGPLRVEGGVVRNRDWLQTKADILGRSFDSVLVPDATAVGAALLAGVGAGCYPDPTTAAAALHSPTERWRPRPEPSRAYAQAYERSYRPLAELMLRLSEID